MAGNFPRVPPLGAKPDQVARTLNHLLGAMENKQTEIANDASGAANQATVNAILAALRAYGIIA